MMKNAKKKAFTLIELLVVIAIIGILATLAVVSLQSARARARDSKRVADVKQMQTALELYFNDNSSYPSDISSGIGTYMAIKPTAPTPAESGCSENNEYDYEQTANGSSYTISFCLGAKTGEIEAGCNVASPGGISTTTCSN